MADNRKCAHENCKCGVAGDSDYCSSFCESAAGSDITEIQCECGHSGCA